MSTLVGVSVIGLDERLTEAPPQEVIDLARLEGFGVDVDDELVGPHSKKFSSSEMASS